VRRVKIIVYIIVAVILSVGVVGQHWIAGYVLDAKDGTGANDRVAVCYAPADHSDNVTNIIGPNGGNFDNEYFLQIGQLTPEPGPGDEIYCKVNESDKIHEAGPVNFSLTEFGFTEAPNMTLNSPPNVPTMGINSTDGSDTSDQDLNCNATLVDLDGNGINVSVRWYRNGTLNLSIDYNNSYSNGTNLSVKLDSANTTTNDNWSCSMQLFDGRVYSGWGNSSNLTILGAGVDPIVINSNGTNPASPKENNNVSIYANVTSGSTILWVNFSVMCPNGTVRIYNENASSMNSDIWNSTSFIADAIGTWNWNISAYDGSTSDETNGSFTISSWHIIMGNISGKLTLDDASGITLINWNVNNISGSNIYIADSDNSISFSNLKALSRNISGDYSSNDFDELDSLLSMGELSDSVNSTFTSDETPKNTDTFTIFGNSITNVPIINSTNSTQFITGILWDSADDGGNEDYDESDKEDVVFITKANPQIVGKYGKYDYEITMPANMRKYDTTDVSTVSIYAEIR